MWLLNVSPAFTFTIEVDYVQPLPSNQFWPNAQPQRNQRLGKSHLKFLISMVCKKSA